jgi:hypothetical protein
MHEGCQFTNVLYRWETMDRNRTVGMLHSVKTKESLSKNTSYHRFHYHAFLIVPQTVTVKSAHRENHPSCDSSPKALLTTQEEVYHE